MADGKLVFLRPASGDGRLVLGDAPAGAPPQKITGLVFSRPASGSGKLTFGKWTQGGAVQIPDAPLGIDAGFAGDGAATVRLLSGTALRIDAGFAADMPSSAALAWDANVSRGGLRHELHQHWQPAIALAAAARQHWQQTLPLHTAAAARWQHAQPLHAGLRPVMREATRLRAAAAGRWQEADARRAAARQHWQEAIRLRDAAQARWQDADRLRGAAVLAWQETIRLRAALHAHWQDGLPARASARTGYGDGLRLRITLAPHWQEAWRPRAGVSRLPPIPPPPGPPPCYDPARLGLLVFDTPYTGDGRLVFVCHRAGPGPDPEPAQWVIPLLRVYMAVHSISAVLLPSLERVQLSNVSIASDDDGYAWHLSATGPEHLLDQLAPVSGLPARIRVTINGIQWVFAVEPPQRTRAFGDFKAQVRGSSVTSLLGSPYMPEQAWSSELSLTAQQIVAQALEFTGVAIDWGLNDWIVHAPAWSHMGSPLSVAQRVAEAAGAVVRSHRTDPVLIFAPKYPHMPWEWPTAPLNVQMPGQIITKDTLEPIAAAQFDTVYVSGTVGGSVKGHVVRAGSAGVVPAQPVVDALMTHEVAARQRGSAILAAAAITKRQPITVPLLTGGTTPGLILPGYLIEVVEPGETWRGLVRGITVTEGSPMVHQALTVERAL